MYSFSNREHFGDTLWVYFLCGWSALVVWWPRGRCSSGIPGKGWSISPDLGECARLPRPTLVWVGGGELWIFLGYFHDFFQRRNAACSVAQFCEMIAMIVIFVKAADKMMTKNQALQSNWSTALCSSYSLSFSQILFVKTCTAAHFNFLLLNGVWRVFPQWFVWNGEQSEKHFD